MNKYNETFFLLLKFKNEKLFKGAKQNNQMIKINDKKEITCSHPLYFTGS